jgi:hypothetical protein
MNSDFKPASQIKISKDIIASLLLISLVTGYIYTPVIFGLSTLSTSSSITNPLINAVDAQAQVGTQSQAGAQSIPRGFTFNQNLSSGQTVNPDVSYLQILLNSDTRTTVALTGAGSSQNPTNYFGQRTKDAVIRFQNLYASEVLAPAGLTTATGFVGSFTRTKLNQMLSGGNNGLVTSNLSNNTVNTSSGSSQAGQMITTVPVVQNGNNTQTGLNLFRVRTTSGIDIYTLSPDMLRLANSNRINISGFSSYVVQRDQTIAVNGSGFAPSNNVVYFGSVPTGPYVAINNGTYMNIKVPTTIPDGNYLISVDNRNGLRISSPIYLTVQGGPLLGQGDKPVLTSISPSFSSFLNQPITIFGRNFLTRNSIVTNLGTINNAVTADPQRLVFLPGQLPNYLTAFNQYRNQDINLLVRVRNDMGTSDQELSHTIRFASSTFPLLTQDRDLLDTANATGTATTSTSTSTTNSATVTDITSMEIPAIEAVQASTPSENQSQSNTSGSNSSNAGAVVAVAAAAVGIGVAASLISNATAPIIDYFGGKIAKSTVCTCSAGAPTLLTIENFNPKMPPAIEAMFVPGVSTLKANFNIWTPGVYTIGGLMPGTPECLVGVTPACTVAGVAQYIIDTPRGIGTSLTPPAI